MINNNNILISNLFDYIQSNEVIFQVYGELVEVSNDMEKKNKENILKYLEMASSVELYEKNHWFIKEEFQDLNDWSQKDDVLFLLQSIGVLICITRKEALANNLITA